MSDAPAGLKVGLEIHQQLGFQGSRKLFCQCPAELVDTRPDLVVHRTLRAAAGETGEVDIAAAAEHAKAKRFAYGAHHQYTCLVELDEEPPHPCDQEAMATALMVAQACGSRILPRVQFMRKTIVDGSNVSGFQRTGLVALGGVVPGTGVRIQTIALEEDAAKIISRTSDEDSYDLARLGIPLIELSTEPDITTPEQAQEIAAHIGMLLRSTRRVRRGIGTIRQDLNVSIAGGARVEIKGCQDLRQIAAIVRNEIRRQQALIAVADTLKDKLPKTHTPVDTTDLFAESRTGFVKKAIAGGARAVGIRVERLNGILGVELLPNHRVGTELADIARSRGFGGLMHSDEDLAKYGVDGAALRERFGCKPEDAFIILIGDATRIASVYRDALAPRIAQLAGVPKEVRKANQDATTSFLRPLSGGARMYPETDIPIVTIDTTRIQRITLLSEQVAELARSTGLSRDLAKAVIEEDVPLDELRQRYPKVPVALFASVAIEWPREIKARYGKEFPNALELAALLWPHVENGTIGPAAVKTILETIAQTGADPASLVQRFKQLPAEDIRARVRAIIAEHPGVTAGGLMGLLMKELRGKADGKLLDHILREELARTL